MDTKNDVAIQAIRNEIEMDEETKERIENLKKELQTSILKRQRAKGASDGDLSYWSAVSSEEKKALLQPTCSSDEHKLAFLVFCARAETETYEGIIQAQLRSVFPKKKIMDKLDSIHGLVHPENDKRDVAEAIAELREIKSIIASLEVSSTQEMNGPSRKRKK